MTEDVILNDLSQQANEASVNQDEEASADD